jgi:hypothetical protein
VAEAKEVRAQAFPVVQVAVALLHPLLVVLEHPAKDSLGEQDHL